jgi:hypothetical protein
MTGAGFERLELELRTPVRAMDWEKQGLGVCSRPKIMHYLHSYSQLYQASLRSLM